MKTIRLQIAGAAAILQRDLLLFLSYRTAAITRNASVLFQLALMYYVSKLVKLPLFGSSHDYFSFVVMGIVILHVTQATFSLPAIVRNELVAGTFERLLLSPLGAMIGTFSMLLFPFLDALFSALLTLVLAIIIFGLDLQWSTAPLAIPIAAVATVAFGGIAMLFASAVILFKQAPGMALALSLMSLVGGYYFPISLLPSWIHWVADVQPFTPTVDLLRHVLVGFPVNGSVWSMVAKIVGFAVVLLPLALWTLTTAIRTGQRRGTIIEY